MRSFFLAIAFLVMAAGSGGGVNAAELIVNGGFETGNLTGWTVVNGSNPFINWSAGGNNHGGGFVPVPTTVSPAEGNFSAWQGVAYNGGSSFTLSQDITLPAAQTAGFFWRDRFQSNLVEFCGGSGEPVCGTHTYRVQILNTSNVVLQTIYTVVNGPNQNIDTGWRGHNFILTPYAGQTIRLRFSTTATVTWDGPGQLDIDSVSVQSPIAPPTSASVTVAGRVANSEGQGVSRAIISMTNAAGVSRTVTTNQIGYYRFSEVAAGETYTIAVSSKRHTFANSPRVVSVNDELTDVDFTAEP